MASLSNIYGTSAKRLFSPQYTALTEKKPRIPLSAIIHAQAPAYKAAKETSLEKKLAEEDLAQEQEQFDKEMALQEKAFQKEVALQEEEMALQEKAFQAEQEQFDEEMKLKEKQLAESRAQAQESQKQAEKATKITGAAAGAAIGGYVATGTAVGGPVGAVVGGVVGYVASGSVLCTELHRQGLLSDEIYHADCEYAKSIPEVVKIGYRIWARYLVAAMQKSSLVTRVSAPFIRAWCCHMAYKMGVVEKGSVLGALLECVGLPICKIIGTAVVKNLSIIDSARERYFNFNMI